MTKITASGNELKADIPVDYYYFLVILKNTFLACPCFTLQLPKSSIAVYDIATYFLFLARHKDYWTDWTKPELSFQL
jgi:hypothetical protein